MSEQNRDDKTIKDIKSILSSSAEANAERIGKLIKESVDSPHQQGLVSIIPSRADLTRAIKEMKKLRVKGVNNKIAQRLIENPDGVDLQELIDLCDEDESISEDRVYEVANKLQKLILGRIPGGDSR